MLAIVCAGGFLLGYICAIFVKENRLDEKFKAYEKDRIILNFLNAWFLRDIEGFKVSDYFLNRNIRTIAIYGAGTLGTLLYRKIQYENAGIVVKYVIDQDTSRTIYEMETIIPGDFPGDVEVIIVSAITAFNDIRDSINNIEKSRILSIKDIVYSG